MSSHLTVNIKTGDVRFIDGRHLRVNLTQARALALLIDNDDGYSVRNLRTALNMEQPLEKRLVKDSTLHTHMSRLRQSLRPFALGHDLVPCIDGIYGFEPAGLNAPPPEPEQPLPVPEESRTLTGDEVLRILLAPPVNGKSGHLLIGRFFLDLLIERPAAFVSAMKRGSSFYVHCPEAHLQKLALAIGSLLTCSPPGQKLRDTEMIARNNLILDGHFSVTVTPHQPEYLYLNFFDTRSAAALAGTASGAKLPCTSTGQAASDGANQLRAAYSSGEMRAVPISICQLLSSSRREAIENDLRRFLDEQLKVLGSDCALHRLAEWFGKPPAQPPQADPWRPVKRPAKPEVAVMLNAQRQGAGG